jgi:hypothetical protein
MTLPPYPDPVVRVPPGHLWIEGSWQIASCYPAYLSRLQEMSLFIVMTATS